MQAKYDDRVPDPENFTKQRPVRIPDEVWKPYGELVGERERSADLKAYIEWRLAHPLADLEATPDEQVLDFFVRIRVTPGSDGPKRRAEIHPIPGTKGPGADQLRTEIAQAIASHFSRPPAAAAEQKSVRRRKTKET